ncbi:MAG: DUF4070 domain-containing protein, partial [Ignavibacteria bacterium]
STLNFIPVLKKEVLLGGYRKILNTIYDPKNYYNRIITYLKEYKEFASGSKLSLGLMISAITRSMWVMGVTERGKLHFWKLILWTLFRKPKLIAEAITQSIYGYHYRTVLLSKAGE